MLLFFWRTGRHTLGVFLLPVLCKNTYIELYCTVQYTVELVRIELTMVFLFKIDEVFFVESKKL